MSVYVGQMIMIIAYGVFKIKNDSFRSKLQYDIIVHSSFKIIIEHIQMLLLTLILISVYVTLSGYVFKRFVWTGS